MATAQNDSISFQVLINPALDLSCNGPIERQDDGLDVLRWQANMYLNDPQDVFNPLVSPLLAINMQALPPALVVLAKSDELREGGQAYADKLIKHNIPMQVYCHLNSGHLAGNCARATTHALPSLKVVVAALT